MTREELNKTRDDLFCEFCGKQCRSLNSLRQHSTRCKENPNRKDFNKLGEYSYNNFKGQNKFTNEIIAKASNSLQRGYDSGRVIPYTKGKVGNFKGKHHTEKTKMRLSEVGRYNASNHLNGWKAGNSKSQNKYEKFTSSFLSDNNINYQSEYVLSTGCKGTPGVATHYQLDFLINNKIDLELDGSGHNFSGDDKRDAFVNNYYIVHRIKHNDSLELLTTELNKFIKWLGEHR